MKIITSKSKKVFIILLIFALLFAGALTASVFRGYPQLNQLKYLVDNGRVVEGEIVNWEKERSEGRNTAYFFYSFALYYRYEENGEVWKTSKNWYIREDKADELEEREKWCAEQVGKTVELIVADNGYCAFADEAEELYKKQFDYVWVRGGVLIALDTVFITAVTILIFYKPKNE